MKRKIVIGLALVALAAMTLAPGVRAEERAVAPKDLYAKKCAMCHGSNGVAKDVGKPSGDFNDPKWPEDPRRGVHREDHQGRQEQDAALRRQAH